MAIRSNLSLRITAILLIGFILLQMLIWAAMTLPSRGDDRRPYNLPDPAQVRTMVDTLDNAPPGRRAALIEMFNGSLYSVRLLDAPPPPPAGTRQTLDELEKRYEAALPDRGIGISGRRRLIDRVVGDRPWAGRLFAPVIITVPMHDGRWLIIDSRASTVVRGYLRQRSMLGAIGGLAILGMLALGVRQTTKPLVRLARSVRQLSADLDTPDLPITGSREMRELSAAFNEMKARIGGLMAERTRMLAGIAHDMRTYLTRLRLRADFIDDAEQRDKAVADLNEMSALLDDTLIFARSDAAARPAPQRIDLGRELADLISVRRDMGDTVDLAPIGQRLSIRATPIALRRMIANLIDNGLRHGGAVIVTAAPDGEAVRIEIADDGPGVPPDAIARLGEPFGRIDPSRDRATGGAGLGLAIVRALADREGAHVDFVNRPAGGFSATLIFANDPPAHPTG